MTRISLMDRVMVAVMLVALTIYCTVEVAQAAARRVRLMPKWLWAVAVICLPLAGPLAWLFFGRPDWRGPKDQYHHPPLAPDDDPDFLGRL